MSDASLGLRHRIINAAMRTVYFGRVRVLDLSGSQDRQTSTSAEAAPASATDRHAQGASPADALGRSAQPSSDTPHPRLIIASHRSR